MDNAQPRLVILNKEKCKPKKCGLKCKLVCPINLQGQPCLTVEQADPFCHIDEILCIGCGMCVKKCPFNALKIVNLPHDLPSQIVHRYSANSFRLHRLPVPRVGSVLGLVGKNGVGKTTVLNILAGKLIPNFGNWDKQLSWSEIIKQFRGSELQLYFQQLVESKLHVECKQQYIENEFKLLKGQVKDQFKDQFNEQFIKELELEPILTKNIETLSGGELQRLCILTIASKNVQVYLFDEPSSFLDVKQRLIAANLIRKLVKSNNYVICVEHDLSILDYLSDFVCCLYGEQTAYGIVTMPFSVREGINIFLEGYIPTENMRFREIELNFKKIIESKELDTTQIKKHDYPEMEKTFGDQFTLKVMPGAFSNSQITILLGENGTGKTTLIKLLAGKEQRNDQDATVFSQIISYKPQQIAPKFQGTVRELLQNKINNAHLNPTFMSEVCKPLKLDEIIDNQVQCLSGGELQRIALVVALGKPADIYLLDEPSAYLDAEQRLITARVIKRFMMNNMKCAFIVEHDFIMATYLADQVIVYTGIPGKECTANCPQSLVEGMNKFLAILGITFRRDPYNYRPRINKLDSQLDQEQKLSGNYFLLED